MIEGDAEGFTFCIGTPTDAIGPFNDNDRFALRNQRAGSRKPGRTSTDDHHVGIGGDGLSPNG